MWKNFKKILKDKIFWIGIIAAGVCILSLVLMRVL